MEDHILEVIDNRTMAIYNFKTDRFHQNNLAGKIPGLQARIEEKLKAVIQTYNERLIDNNLTVKK